ncbi:condensation domain-containing protein [Streptomyces djakartensis]|uniref:condensation domain-containing protein n=1 Tax=Streptomyces djakartensis TaxID=68193 RepID=UPI0034DF67BE
MTTEHTSSPPGGEPTCVVVDLGPAPHRRPRLEVHGPLDQARLQAALGQAAGHLPGAGALHHHVDRHRHGHHTLRLTTDAPHTTGAPGAAPGAEPGETFPYGLLADLLTRPPAPAARPIRTLAPTPLMRELLADADAHPGRHVERLSWAWHGPLDPDRFRAAWQSVVDHESVLRAAFDDSPEPLLVLHDHADADVLWLPHGSVRFGDLIAHDLRRGLDPRRPGGLRVSVLGGGPADHNGTAPAPARVLLTYHHALLDDTGARLLLHEFYRAYLAGGRLPGGERRPDLRDYVRWLGHRDTAAAQQFWSGAAPPTGGLSPDPLTAAAGDPLTAAPGDLLRAAPGPAHRTRIRLTAQQTQRLTAWAARLGCTESSVLHAVWAVLLYRAGATGAPGTAATIRFAVTASGRGILLEGADRLPAALRTPMPLSIQVAPGRTVAGLLTELRDRVLDMTCYEWVSPGQIHHWSAPGRTTATDPAHQPPAGHLPPAASLLAFEAGPRPAPDLTQELAAHGVRVERPDPLGAHTAFPLTLLAHHDDDGALVLTASCHPGPHTDATEALTHSALLLGELPYLPGDTTTVADLLRLPAGTAGRRSAPQHHPTPDEPPGPLPATPDATPAEPPGPLPATPDATPAEPPGPLPHVPAEPPGLPPHVPDEPPGLPPHVPAGPSGLLPHVPAEPPGLPPHVPAGPSGLLPHVPDEPPGLPPHVPAGPPGPRPATPGSAPTHPPLTALRPAAGPDAGVVCLVQTHGTPRSRYDQLAAAYRGPESIVLLRCAPGGVRARHDALRPLTDGAGLLVLGAFCGGGSAAYEIARLIAAHGARPPLVVLTGATTAPAPLARMLQTLAARAGRP